MIYKNNIMKCTYFIIKTVLSVISFFSLNQSCAKDSSSVKNEDIYYINSLIAKTISIGYFIEDTSSAVKFPSKDQLQMIQRAGFTAIRIPVNWVSAMEQNDAYTIDKKFPKEMDDLIKRALKCNLAVILDNQTDEQLMNDPVQWKARYLSLWQQLSLHYQDYSSHLLFELEVFS